MKQTPVRKKIILEWPDLAYIVGSGIILGLTLGLLMMPTIKP